jgi:hypothetical protein
MYLIWSYEHDAWWNPAYRVYTKDISEAGRYDEIEARGICKQANSFGDINEKMISEDAAKWYGSWYYYLHTNGDVIGKNPTVVDSDPEYLNSSFVKKYWLITNISELIAMLTELKKLGVKPDRISDIEKHNGIIG